MDSSRPISETRAVSRNSSIFGSAHTVNRRLLESPGQGQSLDNDNDLEVEDYGSAGSDLEISDSSDYDYEDEGEEEDVPLKDGDENIGKQVILRPEMHVQKKASTLFPDDDVDVSSDEERAIIAEIRDEIKKQVKEEIKDELLHYSEVPETKKSEEKDPTLVDLEPKLREAILKMRKLDRILARKEKREIEVKRERIRLQKRLRKEIEALKSAVGKQPRKEEMLNTERFLSLAPPPSHNEGVEDESPPPTPVFRTQLPESEFDDDNKQSEASEASYDPKRKGSNHSQRENEPSRSDDGSTSTMSGSTTLGSKIGINSSFGGKSRNSKLRRKRKDFIKRNIELASDAANAIAMTDDEKFRLDQLLQDINAMPDIAEDGERFLTQAFEVALVVGDGFSADTEQREQLSRIDDRLSVLAPMDEFHAISSLGELDALKHCQYVTPAMRMSMDMDDLGEPSLQETKVEREMRLKLQAVENQLQDLSLHADLQVDTPGSLTGDQLSVLLGEYARSLSRTTQSARSNMEDVDDESPESESLPLTTIYDNPPRLDQETLDKLLHDARSELSIMSATDQSEMYEDEDEYEYEDEDHSTAASYMNDCDDTKAIKAATGTFLSSLDDDACAESTISHRSSRTTSQQSHHSNILRQSDNRSDSRPDSRRASLSERTDTEPRILLPEINLRRSLINQTPNNQKHIKSSRPPPSHDLKGENLVYNSLDSRASIDYKSYNTSPPLTNISPPLTTISPPRSARRPLSRPRNLSPISTHLEMDFSDVEDEHEQ